MSDIFISNFGLSFWAIVMHNDFNHKDKLFKLFMTNLSLIYFIFISGLPIRLKKVWFMVRLNYLNELNFISLSIIINF